MALLPGGVAISGDSRIYFGSKKHRLCHDPLTMRKIGCLLTAFFFCATCATAAEVDLKLLCLSPQVDPSEAESDIGADYRLSLTSLEDGSINGEMTLASSDTGWSHTGYFQMEDLIFGGGFVIPYLTDLPTLGDANGNGVDDFFDASMEVPSETKEGIYQDPTNPQNARPFTATWQRDANSNSGSVTISISDLGLDFHTTFRILQFDGKFEYNRSGTNLVGQTSFTNVFDPSDTISGPLTLRIRNTNTLAYSSGTWDGLNDFKYDYSPEDNLDRAGLTYVSFIDFADGYPATSQPDYQFWFLLVESQDANTNSIPDVVEGDIAPPTPPSLQAGKGSGGLEITITGTAGQSYTLQSTTALGGTWGDEQNVTLQSATQTIIVETPGKAKFFRLKQ
jgi:hypothetical protein